MRIGFKLLAAGSLCLAATCPALAAYDFTLDAVTIDAGNQMLRANHLEVTGSSLSRDEIAALLAGGDGTLPSARFAKLTIAKIVAPEIVSETKADTARQSVTYRNVALENMVAGRIGHAHAEGVTATTSGDPDGPITIRVGATDLDGVDLPVLAHFMAEGRSDPDEAAKIAVASGQIADVDADLPKGAHGHIGAVRLRNAGGRALAVPMSSLVDLAPKPDASPPGPERQRALSGVVADLLTSQSLSELSMSGLSLRAADGKTSTVESFDLADVVGGKIGRAALAGMSLDRGDAGTTAISHLTFTGLDLKPVLASAVADNATTRAPLLFDRIELDGLAGRLKNGDRTLALDLGHASIDARDWRDLAPQAVGLTVDHLAFDLPPDDARARPLRDLGYSRLDLSMAADAAYDAARSEATVSKLVIGDPAIGSAVVAAQVSNVAADILGSDMEKARAALAASLFRHASLVVTDSGLLARMIDTQAKQGGGSPLEVRNRWAAGVRGFANALLSANSDRGAISDAAEKFVRNGGRFTLDADAPNGLGLIDVMLAGGLQGALGKLKLTAGN